MHHGVFITGKAIADQRTDRQERIALKENAHKLPHAHRFIGMDAAQQEDGKDRQDYAQEEKRYVGVER